MDFEGPVRYLLIGVFGALGAMARYGLDGFVDHRNPGQFPWGIFAVNVIGCFLIGVVMALTTERILPHTGWRLALGVGFLGAFTTFSAFSYDTIRLLEDGAVRVAITYVGATVVLGLSAAWAGLALTRHLS